MSEDLPPFVKALSSGTEDAAALTLTADAQRELNRRLDEMAACRARALIAARDVVVWS